MSSMNMHRAGQPGPGTECDIEHNTNHNTGRGTVCFSVTADAEPSVMGRIFGLFAKRGVMPERWYAQVSGDGELQIDIQMAALDSGEAERYAQNMRQIFCVDRVLTSCKQIAEDAPA